MSRLAGPCAARLLGDGAGRQRVRGDPAAAAQVLVRACGKAATMDEQKNVIQHKCNDTITKASQSDVSLSRER